LVHPSMIDGLALWSRRRGLAVTETILSIPTKFSKGETFTIMGLLVAGIVGAVWTNFELGAIKERGVLVRARLDKLELGRDDMVRVQEQLKMLSVSIEKIDRKLDAQR
jgi:hypothetical protein